MTLASRLAALERRIPARVPLRCSTCEAIPRWTRIVFVEAGTRHEACSECGRPLDVDGSPIGTRAHPSQGGIVVHLYEHAQVSLPT